MALTLIAVVIFPGVVLGVMYLALELLSRAIERVTSAVEGLVVTVATAAGDAVRGPVLVAEDLPQNDIAAAYTVPWEGWGDADSEAFIADPTYGTFPDPDPMDSASRTVSVRPGQGPLPVDLSAEEYGGVENG